MATFTYDPTALEDEPKDRLRAMVGDVATPFNLSDEELQSFYDLAPGIFSAAADAADALAGRVAQDANVGLGVVSIGGGNAARYYMDLADKYRARAVLAGEAAPSTSANATIGIGATGAAATGISVADMYGVESDPDRPDSVFHTARRWSPWGRWP